VLCNTLIKFDLFLEHACALGCDAVATGHYARIVENDTHMQLLKWIDENKDQSYFLSGLSQQQLKHALFPLGAMTKPQVRAYAQTLQLPNAERKDSQWLCFIGNIPMKQFLSKQLGTTPGPIQDTTGKVLGEHPGALFYTIGQREWLWLSGGPRFVVEKNVHTNTLTVGHEDDPRLRTTTVHCDNRHRLWAMPSFPLQAYAKLRYRQADQAATITQEWEAVVLTFTAAQKAVTPWQQAVLYQWDVLLWSWRIVR
jgi:tRNA-specific 2-thiouridylase